MKKILILLFGSLFSSCLFASYPPMPERCPSIASLESIGFDVIAKQPDDPTHWYAKQLGNIYNTEEMWSFGIYGLEAVDENEARNKAEALFATMKIAGGPDELDNDFRWECLYRTSMGVNASAITPPA